MLQRNAEIGERARHVLEIARFSVALQQTHPQSRKLAIALRRHDRPAFQEGSLVEAALAENALLVAAHMPIGRLQRTPTGVTWVEV